MPARGRRRCVSGERPAGTDAGLGPGAGREFVLETSLLSVTLCFGRVSGSQRSRAAVQGVPGHPTARISHRGSPPHPRRPPGFQIAFSMQTAVCVLTSDRARRRRCRFQASGRHAPGPVPHSHTSGPCAPDIFPWLRGLGMSVLKFSGGKCVPWSME